MLVDAFTASSADYAASALCALGSAATHYHRAQLQSADCTRQPAGLSALEISVTAAAATSALTAAGHAIAAAAPTAAARIVGISHRGSGGLDGSEALEGGGGTKRGGPSCGGQSSAAGAADPDAKRRRSDKSQPKMGWTRQEDGTILSMVSFGERGPRADREREARGRLGSPQGKGDIGSRVGPRDCITTNLPAGARGWHEMVPHRRETIWPDRRRSEGQHTT